MSSKPASIWFVGVLGALGGALVTGGFNYLTQERQLDAKFVEIGIGILRAPTGENVVAIQEWAIDLIEQKSGKKFTAEQRTALLRRPLAVIDTNNKYDTAKRYYDEALASYMERLNAYEDDMKKRKPP